MIIRRKCGECGVVVDRQVFPRRDEIARFAVVAVAMTLLAFLAGCGDLDRDAAAKAVKADMKSRETTITMSFGTASTADPGWIAEGRMSAETVAALRDEGYIRTGRGLFGIPVFYPTEKFAPFLDKPIRAGADLHVKLAEFDRVEITGIAKRDKSVRTVEGIKHYVPNELGSRILDERQLHVRFDYSFVKFDDGWRID